MAEVVLQWTGDHTYRGADAELSISLTCHPGDVVRVSPGKAAELQKDPNWKPFKPKSPAGSGASVPGGLGAAASITGDGDPNANPDVVREAAIARAEAVAKAEASARADVAAAAADTAKGKKP